jgi:hypothetical protein
MYKYLLLILTVLLIGCQARGVKPMTNSQLNGKTRVSMSEKVIVPSTEPSKVIEKEILITIPKSTNTFEVTPTKELLESRKPIRFQVVSEPSTHAVQLKVNPEQRTETFGRNFLIFYYGTLLCIVVFYFLYKFSFKKSKNKVDNSEKLV